MWKNVSQIFFTRATSQSPCLLHETLATAAIIKISFCNNGIKYYSPGKILPYLLAVET